MIVHSRLMTLVFNYAAAHMIVSVVNEFIVVHIVWEVIFKIVVLFMSNLVYNDTMKMYGNLIERYKDLESRR